MTSYLIAMLCVIGIASGQILFKVSANALSKSGGEITIEFAASFIAAVMLYGFTSLAWVWALQKESIGQLYPIMALAFILVPILSYFCFNERFSWQYFAGVFLIVVGIAVALKGTR